MSFSNVGKVWSPEMFKEYLKGTKPPLWATSVTIHHTASPSLAQRPDGFTAQHIRNIQSFYQRTLGWSKGPHFFIDDDQIWGMTPPTMQGIHAKSFNSTSIGIEVLGDYDSEQHDTGRGKLCWDLAASATKALLDWLGVSPNTRTIYFHRDDPKTSKTCPGRKVTKDWFIDLVSGRWLRTDNWEEPIYLEMVEVVPYIAQRTRKPYSEIAKALVKKDKQILLFDKWIESAHYDKIRKATVASVEELNEEFPLF